MNSTLIYNRVKKIKDERFNVEFISQYELLLYLNIDKFYISVVDNLDHKCLYLEEIELDPNHVIQSFEEIFDDHHFLRAAFWKRIKFCQYNNKFTLIPQGLFLEENAFDYLDLVADIKLGFDKVQSYLHDRLGMVNVFALDYNIYNWISNFYANKKVVFLHQTSTHIESLMKIKPNDVNEVVDINIGQNSFEITFKKNKKLEFCNVFSYIDGNDVLYFLMAVVDTFGVDFKNCQCNLYGAVDHNSEIFIKVREFLKTTKFGAKAQNIQFGYVFDELFLHQYNSVFSMYHC